MDHKSVQDIFHMNTKSSCQNIFLLIADYELLLSRKLSIMPFHTWKVLFPIKIVCAMASVRYKPISIMAKVSRFPTTNRPTIRQPAGVDGEWRHLGLLFLKVAKKRMSPRWVEYAAFSLLGNPPQSMNVDDDDGPPRKLHPLYSCRSVCPSAPSVFLERTGREWKFASFKVGWLETVGRRQRRGATSSPVVHSISSLNQKPINVLPFSHE